MNIAIGKIDAAPGGIDTAEDLEAARMRATEAHHKD
jgi:CMP-2-keto-3-deoxyoctulosonic acid synthetase